MVRNDCSINFHLSKLSIAKFSILYYISLVRDWKRKLKLIPFGSERVKPQENEVGFACFITSQSQVTWSNTIAFWQDGRPARKQNCVCQAGNVLLKWL